MLLNIFKILINSLKYYGSDIISNFYNRSSFVSSSCFLRHKLKGKTIFYQPYDLDNYRFNNFNNYVFFYF